MAFHNLYSYFATPATISRTFAFLQSSNLDPYIRCFVSSLQNILTIDILQTPDLLDTLPASGQFSIEDICSSTITVSFSRLYRASNILSFLIQCLSEAQGRRFRALLHHSTCQIISSPNNQTFSFFYQCLSFSLRNESHKGFVQNS